MRKFKVIVPFMIVTALFCSTLRAQQGRYYEEINGFRGSRKGMFYLVPEFALWFGTYTNIEAAPQLAYHLSDRWSVGMGPHYAFYRNANPYSTPNFSTHLWGFKSFSRISIVREAPEILPFYLFDELFAHFEYERTSLDSRLFNAPGNPGGLRFWTDFFYIGAGISQRFKGFTSYSILLLLNLNDTMNSLYRNPSYRIGLSIYF